VNDEFRVDNTEQKSIANNYFISCFSFVISILNNLIFESKMG